MVNKAMNKTINSLKCCVRFVLSNLLIIYSTVNCTDIKTIVDKSWALLS